MKSSNSDIQSSRRVPNLVLRKAERQDVTIILELIRELARYEKLEDEVVATWTRLEEAMFGSHGFVEVILAELDGAVAGFALFFPNFSTFLGRPGLYLEDLFVREQYRGRGIGQSLLTAVARIARERSYGRLEWSVLDWNERAMRFYHRLNARPLEEWISYRLEGKDLEELSREDL